MGRKYEVYIDGRPLLIVDGSAEAAGLARALVNEVNTPQEVSSAVDRWKSQEDAGNLVLHGASSDAVWDLFRSGYTFVQAAGGCVTDARGRLLVIRRLGMWDLPKGKVDKGETIDDAALREVREECGLKKVILGKHLCETWHTYERKGRQHLKRTDWYLMRGDAGERLVAQSEEDISEVRWMDAAEVARMKSETYPSLRKVIIAWEAALDQA